MKQKLFTLLTLLVLCVTGAWASTVNDLVTISSDYTFTASSIGEAITSGTLYDGGRILSVGGSSYGNNGFQVKNNRQIAFKVSGACKVSITFKTNGTRAMQLGTTNTGSQYGSSTTSPYEYTVTEGGVLYINATSDLYMQSFTVTFQNTDPRTAVSLAFASSSGSADIAAGATLPTLTVDPNVTAVTSNISYESSNKAVATVTANGALTLVGIGTTTITASFAGDTNYKPATAIYALTVTDATKLGYTEVINPDKKTLEPRWLFGLANTTVTQTFANYYGTPAGAIEDNSAQATVYLNGTADANKYTNSRSWKKMQNGYIVNGKEQWVGYDIAVDDNYVLNLTHLDARILVADDTYKWYVEILDKNGTQVYKSAEQTTKKSETANLSTDINVTNLNGTAHVKLWVTQGGSTKYFSIEKLILTGTTAEDTRPVRTVAFAAGEGSGTAPSDVTLHEGESFTFPTAPLLYKTGETLTAWNDGTSDHNIGTSTVVSGDMNLTALFTANTVALGDAATTVEWTFKTSEGAPTIQVEGNSAIYSKRAIIGETPYDALMTIDATSGKFNNAGNATYAQVNANTKFTIPAVDEMVVTLHCNQPTTAVTDASFDGNDADAFDATARTLTFTYSGPKTEIDIVVNNGGLYPDGISVAYPYLKTEYDAPTIEKSDVFNFEHKGFPVTITAAEGTLNVSTDGTNYEAQVSPYVTYATTTTTYYAKVTGADYNDSEVASLEVVNSYDTSKKYIAWVSASKPTTDLLYNALEEVYNVVPTNYEDTKTVTVEDNIKDADLIFMSETIGGGGNLAKSMKVFVGVKPLINTKLYACTTASGRWGWGTAADIDDDSTIEFDKNYKFLNGVTFTTGKTVSFFQEGTTGKRLNTLEFTAAPTNNVNFGITKSNVSMHAIVDADNLDKQYLGLGLHSNNVAKYSDNAIIVVKNAIEMMLAGEALNTEVTTVSGTISVSGWNSFSSSYALDLSTITGGTAYVATAAANGSVTVAETDKVVAAGTGLLIKGTAGEAFTIDVATANANFSGTNLLVGLPNGGEVAKANNTDTWNYVFGWTDPTDPGFYLVNATLPTLGAGKAYLQTNAALTANPGARLNIVFEGETTAINGIEEVAPVTKTRKVVKNGRLVIETANGEFTVSGARVK